MAFFFFTNELSQFEICYEFVNWSQSKPSVPRERPQFLHGDLATNLALSFLVARAKILHD